MKKPQRSSFKLNPIAAAVAIAMTTQFAINVAYAGSGYGSGVTTANTPASIPTYFANSPSGPAPTYVNGALVPRNDGSGLNFTAQSGTMLRKFVDTLPGFGPGAAPGVYSKVNGLGQYIPVAVSEKWANPLVIDPATNKPLVTNDDYYEIAAVEFTEKLHSDLPKATHLRGYVQLMTPGLLAKGVVGKSFTTVDGQVLNVVDNPHHLGPIVTASKGTAVRVKFTNLLPVGAGGNLFLPVDTTLPGAGVGPDGVTSYTQNRAGMHLVGGQSPWISAGSPHQWVAPAGEAAAYAAGIGKGASSQTLPDMTDPGAGSTYLYFPNDMSARFTFIQDNTTGLTRLNAYAGLEAGYAVTDPIEQTLINGGTLSGGGLKTPVNVAAGTLPADQIPLIIEDKTFVPQNIAQQDAKWDLTKWGQPGDLWFPHVYEPNQDPNMANGANPVGRWDYGPLFWPIFPVAAAKATLPSPSFVPEAYMDTPLVNGTAYPTLTVEPKAYRIRILNASNDRYVNLGFYKADPTATRAPQLDANGNPVVDKAGNQQFLANTEVKMVAAAPIDTAGSPPGWDVVNGVQLPLPQFGTTFPWNINAEPSGPSRAWPTDGRAGGAPDPTTSGPDFVVIGNDGGLLPQGVDIPSQPITYEQNRRSITVTNIYGYGMLLGPAERADTIVDFSAYAGQTLILFNDAPAPTPFIDPRNDYYTGDPDQSAQGGAYTTQPGYGPNTRTIMQVVVGSTVTSGGPLNAAALAAALPAAYGASQPAPLVPESAYNASFGTADADNYGRVATGSAAQPNLDFARSAGSVTLIPGPMNLVTSGGPGTGSGSGYLSAPQVVITSTNGLGSGATATATINAAQQVSSVTLTSAGSGYTALPNVTFIPTSTVSSIVVADGGQGYVATDKVVFNGGGGSGAAATLTVSSGSPILSAPTVTNVGSGYTTNPTVSFTGGGGSGATAIGLINTSAITNAVAVTNGGSGYTAATQATVSAPQTSMVPSAVAGQPPVASTTAVVTATVAYGISGVFNVTTPGAGYDLSFANGGTTVVNFSAPQIAGGVLPTASAIVDAGTGAITSIAILTPGSGYTSAPTVTVTDGLGNISAVVSNAALAATGSIASVAVTTAGTGYTAPPTISFTTGSGAIATTALANPVGAAPGNTGTLSSLFINNIGSGYTSAPTVKITDVNNNSSATATVALAMSAGTITGIKVTNPGTGYTSTPAISIQTATGTGALATATTAAAGVGAQATVVAANTASIPVLTKAEQELYDDYGRYNSTGGVELPYTLVGIQTTVPLNYIDAPTEIIGDDEVQIWKLVDNGFWSNSIHFGMADVQLVNRVGWDGTVKAPATNEVGWKDTVRLNPLEDAIVAVRAKPASVPFGQPRSTRLQDPAQKPGAAGSNMGFTADPAVVSQAGLLAAATVPAGTQLLSTAVNTNVLPGSPTGNYDNEFTWGSAILGHGTNDFTRPVVFNPVVNTPAPSVLSDVTGTGTLNWTDPTPASTPATTLANPQNEIGFKLLQAPVTYVAAAGAYQVSGAFTPFATPYLSLPANVTQYAEPAANVSPAAPAYFAYQVAGYNVAGSTTSNIAVEAPPNAPTGPVTPNVLGLTPGFIAGATTNADVNVTVNWTDNATNETNYIITKTAPGGVVTTQTQPANLNAGSTNTIWQDNGPLVEGSVYKYDVIARNSFGDSKPVLSGTLTAPVSAPLAPTNLAFALVVAPCTTVPVQCRPDFVNLTWTDAAFNEVNYIVTRTGGNTAFAAVTVAGTALNTSGTTLSYQDQTAQEGVAYTYTVTAVNAAGSRATSLAVTVTPTAPTIATNVVVTPSTAVDANGTYVDTAQVSWSDNAYNETGYAILRDGVQVGVTQPAGNANNPMGTGTAGWTASPTLSFTDTGLVDGTTHAWAVQSINAVGTATTAAATKTMPGIVIAPPTNLITTPNRAGSSIGLQWTDRSNNETDFLVEESVSTDGGLTFGAWNVLGIVPHAGALTAQTGGLVNFNRANVPTTVGLVYNFRVSARNLANKSDSHPYLTAQSSLAAPAAPAAPVLAAPALNAANRRVTLTWNAVAAPAGTTISYIVNVNGAAVRTNLTTYNYRPTLAQLTAGITYTVQAVATAIRVPNPTVFGSTTGLPSNVQTLTATAPATPVAPTTLTVTAARLTWNAATGVAAGATVSYAVQQSVDGGVTWTTIAGSPFAALTTPFASPAGTNYQYRVAAQATQNGLTSALSGWTTTTFNAVPAASTTPVAALLATRNISVTWTNVSTNITGFTVQRRLGAGAWATIAPAPVVTKNGTSYSITNTVPAAGSYTYRLLATSLGGNTANTAASNAVVTP